MKNIYDVIDWIELIPFEITRNYVQRMIENVQIYHILSTSKNILEVEKLIMDGHD
jgi:soluble lytic murein transglycosylase